MMLTRSRGLLLSCLFSLAITTGLLLLMRYLVAQDWWPLVKQQDYQFLTSETRHINEDCREGCPFPDRRAKGDAEAPHYLEHSPTPTAWRRVLRTLARWIKSAGTGFRMA